MMIIMIIIIIIIIIIRHSSWIICPNKTSPSPWILNFRYSEDDVNNPGKTHAPHPNRHILTEQVGGLLVARARAHGGSLASLAARQRAPWVGHFWSYRAGSLEAGNIAIRHRRRSSRATNHQGYNLPRILTTPAINNVHLLDHEVYFTQRANRGWYINFEEETEKEKCLFEVV